MDPIELARLGTPALILGILYYLERIRVRMEFMLEQLSEIRGKMIRSDICAARHEEINRRLEEIGHRA